MPRQARFSKDDIVAAGLRIVRAGGFEAISARAPEKELGTSSSPMFTMFKDMNEVIDARPEIAESIALECLGSVEQGYGLSPEQAELLFRQMWPVACGIAALCVKHPEDFPEEEVSKTLSYHFSGIISIIKSGKEVEDVKPLAIDLGDKCSLL